jgi:hypothetical protein
MTELLVALGLIAGVVGVHEIGFWLGSLTRSADEPFDRQVALVRTSTAAPGCVFNRLCIFRSSIALYRSARYHCEGGERTRYCLRESRYYRRTTTRRTEGCAERVRGRPGHVAESRWTRSD